LNLALWLERAGKSHGDRPAIGYGRRVHRNYAELAGRAARLAGALRQAFGLAAGDRVAIIAKNSPEYVELMFGSWHAGLVRSTPSCMAANAASSSSIPARAPASCPRG